MAIEASPVEIKVTLRKVENSPEIKEYALKKLTKVIDGIPNLKSASVEIGYEQASPIPQRYIIQVTLSINATILRAEYRAPDVRSAIDEIHDILGRRIRDWKGRVYYSRRREAAKDKSKLEEQILHANTQTAPNQIVRIKRHETKPMFPEDAVEQMELLGHDFYYFLNAESGEHNVVYRRKAGGYGLIVPELAKEA